MSKKKRGSGMQLCDAQCLQSVQLSVSLSGFVQLAQCFSQQIAERSAVQSKRILHNMAVVNKSTRKHARTLMYNIVWFVDCV